MRDAVRPVRVAAVRSPRAAAALGLGLTIVLFASAFPVITVALRGFDARSLAVARLTVAAVALAVAAPLLRVRRPRRADLPRIALAAATGMTAYQLLLNAGQEQVTAGTASLLIATSPVLTALLAGPLLAERFTRLQWSGAALTFAGGAVLALQREGGITVEPGALAVLGAALCQATFFVITKPLLARYRSTEVTAYAMWTGALLALPFAGGLADDLATAPRPALAAVAWLGLGASVVGFVAWSVALRHLPAGVAANGLSLVPPVALVLAWLGLGERPDPGALAGGALCLAGVALVRRGDRARARRVQAGRAGDPLRRPGRSSPAAPRSSPTPPPC